jgi:hypothetical protein
LHTSQSAAAADRRVPGDPEPATLSVLELDKDWCDPKSKSAPFAAGQLIETGELASEVERVAGRHLA